MLFKGRNEIPYIYSCYGNDVGRGNAWHYGTDIVGLDSDIVLMPTYNGKPIIGTVIMSTIVTNKYDVTWEWGNFVCVRLDANQTPDEVNFLYFCHNNQNLVKVGDRIKSGDAIAIMGNTGNAKDNSPPYKHVHFEVRASRSGKGLPSTNYTMCENDAGVYGNAINNLFEFETIQAMSKGDFDNVCQLLNNLKLSYTIK